MSSSNNAEKPKPNAQTKQQPKKAAASTRTTQKKAPSSRRKPVVVGGATTTGTPRRNQNSKRKNRSVSIDSSQEPAAGSADGSPRGKVSREMWCAVCNYRAPAEKAKKGFLKSAFKKTMSMWRHTDASGLTLNPNQISDTEAEYSDAPNSPDMFPIPMVFGNEELEQEIAKNKTFRKDGGVFNLNRPWWTIKDATAIPPYQPISRTALENLYLKDKAIFDEPVFRVEFFDPISDDVETLKSSDAVHNAHNRVICNTFFSGVRALAAKPNDSDRKKKEQHQAAKKVLKFEEPFYLHQYDRKDRFSDRRTFVHVEYGFRHRCAVKEPTTTTTTKEANETKKKDQKGIVCD